MASILVDERFTRYHDLVRRYQDASWAEHMAVVWWVSNEQMLDNSELNKHLIVYENLCRDPHGKTQEIFNFLGWTLSKQTTEYITSTSNVAKSESGMFSVKKNAEEAMTRWRVEIDPKDYERICKMLEPCKLLDLWRKEDLMLVD